MYEYWGKASREPGQATCHLLVYHSLDVAACGVELLNQHTPLRERLASMLGMDTGQLTDWLAWFLAVHDLGKFSHRFQSMAPHIAHHLGATSTGAAYTVRHDSTGFALWDSHIRGLLTVDRREGRLLDVWARCVTGHHGAPPSRQAKGVIVRTPDHFRNEDINAACRYVSELDSVLARPEIPTDVRVWRKQAQQTSWWVAGVAVLVDWLGSNTQWFPYDDEPAPLDAYWVKARQRAACAIREAGILPVAASTDAGFATLFPGWTPSPLQAHMDTVALAHEPQMVVIEDLTGSGKSEAALTLAQRLITHGTAQGLYWALPTMATANGMYDRMRGVYQRLTEGLPSLVLAHGNRALVEFQDEHGNPESATARAAGWVADSSKRSLLSHIGVGTIDQCVMAALHSKHNVLRLLGLLEKVLVVDEVHACDAYQLGLLSVLIELHARAGGSVVLLSATLPIEQRQLLAGAWARGRKTPTPKLVATAYPLVTHISDQAITETPVESAASRTVRVSHQPKAAKVVEQIVVASQSGACVCWIRNTVRDATEAYDQLRAQLGDSVELFHARFTMDDRLTIEQRVLERFGKRSTPAERQGRVLVATQVVEQSLDLDFDLMVTDLAPVDLVIQRAGRLHRHERGERGVPELVLHCPIPDIEAESNWLWRGARGTAAVYEDHGRMWLTADLLLRDGQFTLPSDARRLVECVYGTNATERVPAALKQAQVRATANAAVNSAAASHNAIRPQAAYEADGQDYWRDEFTPTRLGEPTITLVLGQWHEGRLTPLNDVSGDRFTWARSALRVQSSRIAQVPIADPSLSRAINQVPIQPWERCLPLFPIDGAWHGTVVDANKKVVSISYDRERGFVW